MKTKGSLISAFLTLLFLLPIFSHACGSFPTGVGADDMVMEFVASSGQLRQTSRSAAGTPREGMMVYDSTDKALKICDGTDWKTVDMGTPPAGPGPVAAIWGSNSNGQLGSLVAGASASTPAALNPIDPATTVWKMIVTGVGSLTCGIRSSDDRVFCWGYNNYGQLGDGTTVNKGVPTALSSTGGWDTTAWKSISTGGSHTCAIRLSDDRLFCWGYNLFGQLGDGTTTNESVPTALSSTDGWDATAWKSLSTGADHNCAVRASDDLIFCWGYGAFGKLGNGTTTNKNVPTALSSTGGWDATAWKGVSTGTSHTCAIRSSDDLIFCWGRSNYGQLGSGSTDRSVPTALSSTGGWDTTAWKSVSTGVSHTCAIRLSDDLIFCWGYNNSGQLGDGTTTNKSFPIALTSTGGWDTTAWKSVSAGGTHTCGVRVSDDRLFCWGSNGYGQLGDGTTTNESIPTALISGGVWNATAWKSVSAGGNHACGIRSSDDRLFCWGSNGYGQLGDETTSDRTVPTALSSTGGWDATAWKSVSAGGNHTCAIRSSDERLFCWGYNYYRQLGDGTATNRSVPTALSSTGGWDVATWKSVYAGGGHTCGIRSSDDRLFCWGYNNYGQVGDGTTTNKNVPTALSSTGGWDATAWKSVSAGSSHTCGVRSSDDGLFCWGYNNYGQVGDGTATNKSVPTALSSTGGWDATAWKSVSAGSQHTCAVRLNDDLIFCWGYNAYGRLGDGTTTNKSVPTALSSTGGWDATAWKSVSAGGNHTCGIRASDDRLFCWGYNSSGQLGNGTTANKSVPTALSTTGGWDAIAWESVSTGSSHTIAIQSDPTACPSLSSNFDSGDLVIQLVAQGGKTKMGAKSSFSSGAEGVLAYDRSDEQLKICQDDKWRPMVLSTAGACSSYTGGVSATDRVIEWRKDGGGKTYSSNPGLRPTPRLGSMIYDSTAKTLKICDGTNWNSLTTH